MAAGRTSTTVLDRAAAAEPGTPEPPLADFVPTADAPAPYDRDDPAPLSSAAAGAAPREPPLAPVLLVALDSLAETLEVSWDFEPAASPASAAATAGIDASAAPMPSATASAPTRPTWLEAAGPRRLRSLPALTEMSEESMATFTVVA